MLTFHLSTSGDLDFFFSLMIATDCGSTLSASELLSSLRQWVMWIAWQSRWQSMSTAVRPSLKWVGRSEQREESKGQREESKVQREESKVHASP